MAARSEVSNFQNNVMMVLAIIVMLAIAVAILVTLVINFSVVAYFAAEHSDAKRHPAQHEYCQQRKWAQTFPDELQDLREC